MTECPEREGGKEKTPGQGRGGINPLTRKEESFPQGKKKKVHKGREDGEGEGFVRTLRPHQKWCKTLVRRGERRQITNKKNVITRIKNRSERKKTSAQTINRKQKFRAVIKRVERKKIKREKGAYRRRRRRERDWGERGNKL